MEQLEPHTHAKKEGKKKKSLLKQNKKKEVIESSQTLSPMLQV